MLSFIRFNAGSLNIRVSIGLFNREAQDFAMFVHLYAAIQVVVAVTYKCGEVETFSIERMAEPDVVTEIVHVEHQPPHSILQ